MFSPLLFAPLDWFGSKQEAEQCWYTQGWAMGMYGTTAANWFRVEHRLPQSGVIRTHRLYPEDEAPPFVAKRTTTRWRPEQPQYVRRWRQHQETMFSNRHTTATSPWYQTTPLLSGVNCGSRQFPCVESEDAHVGRVEVVVPAEKPQLAPPNVSPILSGEKGGGSHTSAQRLPVAKEQIPAEQPSTFSAEGDTDSLHPGAQPMRVGLRASTTPRMIPRLSKLSRAKSRTGTAVRYRAW